MIVAAVRAGFGIAAMLGFFGALPGHSLSEPFLIFIAAGVVPGTDITIPAEGTLVLVAGVLMALTILLYRQYAAYQAKLRRFLPEFVRNAEDPPYTQIVPGLGRVARAGRSLLSSASELTLGSYFWLRSLGEPLVAQAVTARGQPPALLRVDRRIFAKLRHSGGLKRASATLRRYLERIRVYLARLTLF